MPPPLVPDYWAVTAPLYVLDGHLFIIFPTRMMVLILLICLFQIYIFFFRAGTVLSLMPVGTVSVGTVSLFSE